MARSAASSSPSDSEELWPLRSVWFQSPRETSDLPVADPAPPAEEDPRLPHQPGHSATEHRPPAEPPLDDGRRPARWEPVAERTPSAGTPVKVAAMPLARPTLESVVTAPLIGAAVGVAEAEGVPPAEDRPPRPRAPMSWRWLPPVALLLVTTVVAWLILTRVPELIGGGPPVAEPSAGATSAGPPPSAVPVPDVPIAYATFADPTGLAVSGAAAPTGSTISLVGAAKQTGAVWSAFAINTGASMNTAFRYAATDPAGSMAFVLHTRLAATAGSAPAALGPRLQVEMRAGEVSVSTIDTARKVTMLGHARPDVDLGGSSVVVWVDYLAGARTLRVFVSTGAQKPADPLLTATVGLAATLGKGPAHAGFVAASTDTAGAVELTAWHLAVAGR